MLTCFVMEGDFSITYGWRFLTAVRLYFLGRMLFLFALICILTLHIQPIVWLVELLVFIYSCSACKMLV